MEKEIKAAGCSSDLNWENQMLRNSIQKLKSLLKDNLECALKRNKEELTIMFE